MPPAAFLAIARHLVEADKHAGVEALIEQFGEDVVSGQAVNNLHRFRQLMVLHDVDGVQNDLADAVVQERLADRRQFHGGVFAGVQVAFAPVEDPGYALLIGKDVDFHVSPSP